MTKKQKFQRGDYIHWICPGTYTEVIGVVISHPYATCQNLTLGYKGSSDTAEYPATAKKLPKWKVDHLKDSGYFQCEWMKKYVSEVA